MPLRKKIERENCGHSQEDLQVEYCESGCVPNMKCWAILITNGQKVKVGTEPKTVCTIYQVTLTKAKVWAEAEDCTYMATKNTQTIKTKPTRGEKLPTMRKHSGEEVQPVY